MMKDRAMKYIPGPWVICEDPAPNPYWTAGLTIGAGPGDLRRICDVTMLGSIGGGISPMQAATAALIAAAPDLLAVLQKIHAHGYTTTDDHAMVSAAIAKASPP